MAQYWFEPKRYGYGATPTTWQGWAVTCAAVVVAVGATVTIARREAVDSWFWVGAAVEAAVIAGLIVVSRRKTRGEWRWRWGQD